MHARSVTAVDPAEQARKGSVGELMAALQDSRAHTLRLFTALQRALPDLRVPCHPELNPPLWELGHVGWFQARWLERNVQWSLGEDADPQAPRRPSRVADADALYDSSDVPHMQRWHLPLPDAEATRTELHAGLHASLGMLERLATLAPEDQGLYFFRLTLLHEDMHHEAGLYMARALGVPVEDPRWQPRRLGAPPAALTVPAQSWTAGSGPGQGFAFDNERSAHEQRLSAFEIDAQAVRWAEFLPFVESGGYAQRQWWTPEGWAWRHGCSDPAPPRQADSPRDGGAGPVQAPRYLRRDNGGWRVWQHGRWQTLDPEHAACHLSLHEAQAWCAWAGRRLPTEFEWECAAHQAGFAWGEVWEWTASAFAPYPGFRAHPYRDYSAPWFDGRPVLRGGSFMTQPRMRHRRYRNYFAPHRRDVATGFRTCAQRLT